jgi:predicted transglutaminase-like cysteine proteinase
MGHKHSLVLAGALAAALLTLGGCASQNLVTGTILPAGSLDSGNHATPAALALQAPMPETGEAPPPPGFIGFCIRLPDQCKTPEGAPGQLTLTAQGWQTLVQVNQHVNDTIWQEEDIKHYGRAEYWTIPTDGYGDCEDIALAKRKELIDAGMPVPALRIAVVVTPRQQNHAVLTVSTDRGDYVLDSLRDDIRPWSQAGYKWIERQDAARSSGWASLEPEPTYSVASAASGSSTLH